jgi:hypothetical protein
MQRSNYQRRERGNIAWVKTPWGAVTIILSRATVLIMAAFCAKFEVRF